MTLTVRAEVGSLRRHRALGAVRQAIASCHKVDFRVVEFSAQGNHLHLVVEAAGADSLTRGVIGLEVRIARRVNRAVGRQGRFFSDRYHARALRTPAEVRAALRYVLLNHRHHAAHGGLGRGAAAIGRSCGLDPCSSGLWFDGWIRSVSRREAWQRELLLRGRPTASATVWLLTTGWKRRGLLDWNDVPGRPPRSSGRPRRSPG